MYDVQISCGNGLEYLRIPFNVIFCYRSIPLTLLPLCYEKLNLLAFSPCRKVQQVRRRLVREVADDISVETRLDLDSS
jgi:hypothetical protein